jgi:hypothetical protein
MEVGCVFGSVFNSDEIQQREAAMKERTSYYVVQRVGVVVGSTKPENHWFIFERRPDGLDRQVCICPSPEMSDRVMSALLVAEVRDGA